MELNSTDIITMYKECRSIETIARFYHVGTKRINEILIANNVQIINKKYRTDLPENEIVHLYNDGMSAKQLSLKYSVDRSAINRILTKHNIPIRNGSESMYLRMAQATPEERKALVSKAHDTVRNKPKEYFYSLLKKGSLKKETTHSVVGIYESYIANKLKQFNLPVQPQLSFGLYNIDVACNNIAIEIHNSANLPHTHKTYIKRVENLLKAGWCVIYFKFEKKVQSYAFFDNLINFCALYSTNELIKGEYLVLDSYGKVRHTGILKEGGIDTSVATNTTTLFKAL